MRSAAKDLLALALIGCLGLGAQLGWAAVPGAGDAAPPSARAQAPWNPEGYWVSLITRDWRYRMVVPGKGELAGIPINLKAKEYSDAWRAGPDEAAGKQCEAYGGGSILLVPERLHISWDDDDTLRIRTDAGMQSWQIHFEPPGSRHDVVASWQGYATAQWNIYRLPPVNQGAVVILPGASRNTAPAPRYGSFEVQVSHLLPGLIRKNGVPYSGDATLTQFWEENRGPTQAVYLTVGQIMRDPSYLTAPYNTTATFEREANGSGWDPTPCTLTSTP